MQLVSLLVKMLGSFPHLIGVGLDALLARLGSRLDALGPGPVDLPERQRTLRATVEWSVGLLAEAGQQMLATLSVFVGG